MKVGKRILAVTLLTSMVMGGGGGFQKVFADELTDPYIPRIRSGEIKPPQYMDNEVSGPNPSVEDWIKSVESQGEASKIDGAIKWNRNQKEFKIKKLDQSGKPVKGVVFSAYNTKADAENNKNALGSATSDANGDVKFMGLPLYYSFYVKETSVPEGYTISEEIIPVYRDNGLRFIGEKKANDFDRDLSKYLQSLMRTWYLKDFTDQIDWLVFNDNGVEKLISKKPLKYNVFWSSIDDVGLVDGSKTVTVDGKTYKIRLMRAYSDETDPNQYVSNALETGSEWNRMILPLIGVNGKEAEIIDRDDYRNNPYGRFGGHTMSYVEQNMPALANYTWWKDFGGNSHMRGLSDKDAGVSRWVQNVIDSSGSDHMYRGICYSNYGAAYSGKDSFNPGSRTMGWQPLLEASEQNPSNTLSAENRRVDTSLANSDSNKADLTKQESKNEKGIIEKMKEKIGEIFRRD